LCDRAGAPARAIESVHPLVGGFPFPARILGHDFVDLILTQMILVAMNYRVGLPYYLSELNPRFACRSANSLDVLH